MPVGGEVVGPGISSPGGGSGGGTNVISGNGNPNTNVSGGPTAGTLNQLYQNLTATGQDDWVWRCSVTGTGGAGGTAVWEGKL